jgi:predicted transcriptional regulator
MFFRRKIKHLREGVKLSSYYRHALFEGKSSTYGIYDDYDDKSSFFTSKKKIKKGKRRGKGIKRKRVKNWGNYRHNRHISRKYAESLEKDHDKNMTITTIGISYTKLLFD